MKFLHKGKKTLLLLLFGIFVLTMTSNITMATTVTAENIVSYAKKNKIKKGKWIENKSGIRYKKKKGDFVTDTWCSIGGSVYCFDQKGYVKTGTFKYDKKFFHANAKGKIYVKKWHKSNSKTYYYDSKGVRAKGWVKIKGKNYFFTRTGELVTNSWVGNSYVGKNGARVSGKVVQGRKIDKSGDIKKASKKDKYIFVGASHGVDMSVAANSSDTIFIVKNGAGLRWLKSTAGPKLMSYLNRKPEYKVIFQLGGNDLDNIDQYIAYYKKLLKKYPKTQFYFLENIPGDGNYALTYKNEAKKRYDQKLRAAFGKRCIEAYNYMETTGFRTVDGAHYVLEDIRKVYKHMIRAINAA